MALIGYWSNTGYTFLWSIVYGFVISILISLILLLFGATLDPVSVRNPQEVANQLGSLFLVFFVVSASGFVAYLYLTYKKPYTYGYTDCETENKLKGRKYYEVGNETRKAFEDRMKQLHGEDWPNV